MDLSTPAVTHFRRYLMVTIVAFAFFSTGLAEASIDKNASTNTSLSHHDSDVAPRQCCHTA